MAFPAPAWRLIHLLMRWSHSWAWDILVSHERDALRHQKHADELLSNRSLLSPFFRNYVYDRYSEREYRHHAAALWGDHAHIDQLLRTYFPVLYGEMPILDRNSLDQRSPVEWAQSFKRLHGLVRDKFAPVDLETGAVVSAMVDRWGDGKLWRELAERCAAVAEATRNTTATGAAASAAEKVALGQHRPQQGAEDSPGVVPAVRADSAAATALVARARYDAIVEAEFAKQRRNWLNRMLESADALGAQVQARKELGYLTDELDDVARMLQDVATPLAERFASVRASTDPEIAAAGMRELGAALGSALMREDHATTNPLSELPDWEHERQADQQAREKAEAEAARVDERRALRKTLALQLQQATYFVEADAERELGRPSNGMGEFLYRWARQMARLQESPTEADLPGVLKRIAAAADGAVEKAAIDLLARGAAGQVGSIEGLLVRLHKVDNPFFLAVAEYLRAGGRRPGDLIECILDAAFPDLAAPYEAGDPATGPPDAAPILPEKAGISELARHFGVQSTAIELFLRRYRDKYPDCCITVDEADRRRNEPKYLYRTKDVGPALKAYLDDKSAE
jgi:hypothetical protein